MFNIEDFLKINYKLNKHLSRERNNVNSNMRGELITRDMTL